MRFPPQFFLVKHALGYYRGTVTGLKKEKHGNDHELE
jgi:hypothetical protein